MASKADKNKKAITSQNIEEELRALNKKIDRIKNKKQGRHHSHVSGDYGGGGPTAEPVKEQYDGVPIYGEADMTNAGYPINPQWNYSVATNSTYTPIYQQYANQMGQIITVENPPAAPLVTPPPVPVQADQYGTPLGPKGYPFKPNSLVEMDPIEWVRYRTEMTLKTIDMHDSQLVK